MNYKITTILLTLISVVLLTLTIYYKNTPQVKYETVTKNDTILIKSVDTITVTKKDIVYKNVIVTDTIYLKDTSLFVEQKVFEDSLSTIFISGVNPNLDSIYYRIPRDTVQILKETTNTISQKESFWHNRFVVTAGVYAGYGLLNRQPDIYVGLGFGVRLY